MTLASSGAAAAESLPASPRMRRYLPLALGATGAVIVLPALLVAALVPQRGVGLQLLSAALAVALSLALAVAGAALWKRAPGSRDVVFSELMLWGWAHRCWTERRLSQARALYEAARRAGPRVNIELLLGLSRLIEARDAYVHGHSRRVARHAARIARTMGLSPREVAKIRTAAEVHDVGKLYTPREILNNPHRLSEAEFTIVKEHAAQGAEMVSAVGDPEITAMVRHHHERIDGGGYPDGLAGSAIPLGARIVAVADTFDAITSDRAYRSARPQREALEALAREAGRQLDADAVAAFRQGYSARRSVAWYAAGAAALQRAALALQPALPNLGASAASLGALAPALGAAGVLALSPGLFQVSRGPQTLSAGAGGSLALVQPLQGPGPAAPGRAGGGTRGAAGGGRRPTAPAHVEPRSPAGTGLPGTPGASSTSPAAGGTGAAGAGAGEGRAPGGSGGEGSSPGGGAGGEQPPGTGSKPPSVTVPSVSTPPVTTPAVSVPPVTTPGVSAGGVTVPGATAPGVTVPSATVPSVKAGG